MELLKKLVNLLNDKKAKDMIAIDVSQKSSFTDYLLIVTGGSERQIDSLAEEVKKYMTKEALDFKGLEGKASSGWILLDCGDIIVNIFSNEQRNLYQLEKIWTDGEFINLEE